MSLTGSVFTEENFRKMVEYAPIGILIIDHEKSWQFVNRKFCEITGYSREDLIGKTFLDITYPEDIENNLQLYHRMISGEIKEYFYEKRYIRKDGRVIWVRLSVAGVWMDGEYSHMVVSVEDIDASKQHQKAIESKNLELDRLFYKASHDLKAPVATLAGLCHLLSLEHVELRHNESFRYLEKTISYLKKQNELLLEVTKIYEWVPRMSATHLEQLVRNTAQSLHVNGTPLRLTDLDVCIDTDPGLLAIAVRNILDNAIRYVKPGLRANIIVDYVAMPGAHKLTVSDQGTGIPRQEMDQIFSMFHKAHEKAGGSGMGLYIASKAIERLSGRITVASEEGDGSSFSIILPDMGVRNFVN